MVHPSPTRKAIAEGQEQSVLHVQGGQDKN